MSNQQLSEVISDALDVSGQARQYQMRTQQLSLQCDAMHHHADITRLNMRQDYEQHLAKLQQVATAFEITMQQNRTAARNLTQMYIDVGRSLSALTLYLTDGSISAAQLTHLAVLIQTLHAEQVTLIEAHASIGEQSFGAYLDFGRTF